jgi:hypothetical protein
MKRWNVKRKLALVVLLVSIPLIGMYFFVTSSFFWSRIALPLVCRHTGLQMNFDEMIWRPFANRIELRNLTLGPVEAPFVTAEQASGVYRPFRLLRGIISFSQLNSIGMKVFFHCDANGLWRYEKLVASMPTTAKAVSGKSAWPLRLDLDGITFSRAEASFRRELDSRIVELRWSGVELQADNFANGEKTAVAASGTFRGETDRSLRVEGPLSISGEIDWDETFVPSKVNLVSSVSNWRGAFAEYPIEVEKIGLWLEAERQGNRLDVTRFDLDQASGAAPESRIAATGSIVFDPWQFQFKVEKVKLSDDVLALFSDFFLGINPGRATFAGGGQFGFDADRLSAAGTWGIERSPGAAIFSGEKLELPGFTFKTEHDVLLDFKSNRVTVNKLDAELVESGRLSCQVRLRSPINVDLNTATALESPGVDFNLNDLDLKLFRFLFPGKNVFQFAGGRLSGSAGIDFSENLSGAKFHGILNAGQVHFQLGGLDYRNFGGRVNWDSELQNDLSLEFRRCEIDIEKDELPLFLADAQWCYSAPEEKGSMRLSIHNLSNEFFSLPHLKRNEKIQKILAPFRPLSGGAELEIALSRDQFDLGRLNMEVVGNEECRVKFETYPQRFHRRTGKALDDWIFQLEVSAPAKIVNPLIPEGMAAIEAGQVKFNGRVRGNDLLTTYTASGKFGLENVSGAILGIPVHKLDFEDEFSIYRPETGRIHINTHNVYCRMNGQPSIRLEAPGFFDPKNGDFEARVVVRYLNERVLNFLAAGRVLEAAVTGSLLLRGNADRGSSRLSGNLAVGKFRTSTGGIVATGQLQFDLSRTRESSTLHSSKIELYQGPRQLAIVTGEAVIPRDRAAVSRITVSSSELDLPMVLPLFDFYGPGPAPGRMPAEVIAKPYPLPGFLDFGERETQVKLALDDIRWENRNDFSLYGDIRLQGRRLDAEHLTLTINQSPVDFSLHLLDSANGLAFSSAGRSRMPIAIDRLSDIFYPNPIVGGVIDALNWNLSAKGLPGAKFSTLNGRIGSDVTKLKISNHTAGSPLGRLILLPTEALIRAGTLIPQSVDVKADWRRFWAQAAKLDSPFGELNFDRGELALSFTNGEIEVEKFRLFGAPVQELLFSGGFSLNGEQPMNLESEVRVSGLRVEIPIRGTFARPEISTGDLLRSLTGGQFTGLLEKAGDVIAEKVIPKRGDPDEQDERRQSAVKRWLNSWFGGEEKPKEPQKKP